MIKLDDYEKELLGFAREIVYYLKKSGVAPETAFDISQDILVKMLESEIILPPEKMRAWMYRTAIRTYIDTYRRDKKYQEILQKEFFGKEPVQRIDGLDYEPLYQAVRSLKENYRMVVELYYFQELSVHEISQVLHLSISNVKVILMRGRRQLREILEKEGYHNEDFQ